MTTEAFGLKIGDRIRLVQMGPDPEPMEAGATGTVRGLVDWGEGHGLNQIQVDWDPHIGRALNLCPEIDVWEKITEEEFEEDPWS